jgi:hypothetical protein
MAKKSILHAAVVAASLSLTLATACGAIHAEDRDKFECSGSWDDGDRGFCEIREQRLEPVGQITVAPGMNGGVEVRAWDRNEILVRARVTAHGRDTNDAKELASQVRIVADGGHVRAEGPEKGNDTHWSASFQVLAPARTDAEIETFNGGIAISGMRSNISFTAQNGGVALSDIGGSVRGRTTNGGLAVHLTGARWEGEMLDVATTNGGVSMRIPASYSAHLETETTHGGFRLELPIGPLAKGAKRVSVDLGGGGPLVRATTVNGGVSIRQE